jgi:hypothetical protein
MFRHGNMVFHYPAETSFYFKISYLWAESIYQHNSSDSAFQEK